MSNLGSLRDRKRSPGILGGRTLAAAVVIVIAAVSFSLGYNLGRSGMDGRSAEDQVQVVPEGAGLVLLGGQGACEEGAKGVQPASSAADGASAGSSLVLETMKPPAVPEPDSIVPGQGPDEPVLEPIAGRKAVSGPAVNGPAQSDRRVAPIGQLPEEKEPGTQEGKNDERGSKAAETVVKSTAPAVKKEAPVTRKAPETRKTTAVASRKTPEKNSTANARSDGRAFGVQIGAFASLSDARTHRVRFTKKGYKASIYKDSGPGGSDIYKVRIGMFTSRTEAENMARRLESAEGVHGFVTTIQ